MAIEYRGKWGGSPDGDSPTVWVDRERGLIYGQGWTVTDPEVIAELLQKAGKAHIPPEESIVSFPLDMAGYFQEDTGEAGSDTR